MLPMDLKLWGIATLWHNRCPRLLHIPLRSWPGTSIWMDLIAILDKAGSRENHYNALALIMMAQDFWLVEELAPG